MSTIRPVTLTAETKAKLRSVSTATLTTQLNYHGFQNSFLTGVAPLRPDMRMVGYAVTLRFVPSREDMRPNPPQDNLQRQAIEATQEDDVLVIDARGELRSAVLGDILAQRLQVLGAAGIVTDGAVRDSPACAGIGLPLYVQGVQANRSSLYHHPADRNVPVGCAGVLIFPGDIIVGDGEGVVAIPAAVAESVADAAYEQELREEHILELVRGGRNTLDVYPANDSTEAEFQEWRKSRTGEDHNE